MAPLSFLAAVLLGSAAHVAAQQIGSIPEVHPKLPTQVCTNAGGCVTKQTTVVADFLMHPVHDVKNKTNFCATREGPLNTTLCPDPVTCAKNCVVEGVDYAGMGIYTTDNALTMRQWQYTGNNWLKTSPRVYLLAEDDRNYQPLKLLGQEFTFDVDTSRLGCGMNGALYFSEMDVTGARSALNPGGAQYGHAYCDAQCFSTSFVAGLANTNSSGICCNEMDLWESNAMATAYTPHTCSGTGGFLCQGDACKRGAAAVCDKNGCGLNPYSFGNTKFYGLGPGNTVDTSRPFTVVTQFLTNDNTTNGVLTSIRRLYVQGGKVIPDPPFHTVNGTSADGTMTQDFCTSRGATDFLRLGGLRVSGQSLARGMVLAMSVWAADGDFMNWLDSTTDSGVHGPCGTTAGDPRTIMANTPDVSVTFSNIRWGELGSTFQGAMQQ